MHIPMGTAKSWKIDLFDDALARALTPHTDYDCAKWLYVPDYYTEYRYLLGTRGQKPLICIGINPSTAAPDDLDRTLQSVERIAHGNGYDSFLMFNVYPQRATRPDDMEGEESVVLHRENMRAFRWALEQCGERPAVWAAWGTNVERRTYLTACMTEMAKIGSDCRAIWYCAGAPTKSGHPRHPLYMKSNTVLQAFDMETYLSYLRQTIKTNQKK